MLLAYNPLFRILHILLHSQILRLGSDYFRALLQPGWAEENGNTLHVDAAHSACTFKAVLSWIYTQTTTPLEAGDLPALMRAASFYLLPDLHAECLRMVRGSLNVHNALEWLLFAEENQEMGLRTAAFGYAASNYHRMRQQLPQQSNERLQTLMEAFPQLLIELTDAAMDSAVGAASKKRKLYSK